MVAPLFVGREKSIRAIERAFAGKTPIILSSQREAGGRGPGGRRHPAGRHARHRAAALQAAGRQRQGARRGPGAGAHRALRGDVAALPGELQRRCAADDRDAARCRALARRVAGEFAELRADATRSSPTRCSSWSPRRATPTRSPTSSPRTCRSRSTRSRRCWRWRPREQRLLALLESLAEENAVLGMEQEIAHKVQQRIEGAQRQMLPAREAARASATRSRRAATRPTRRSPSTPQRAGRGRRSRRPPRKLVERELAQAAAGAAHEPRGRRHPRPARHGARPALGQARAAPTWTSPRWRGTSRRRTTASRT